ncbi:hypothetical protein AB0E56_03105 [Microbacterium sp. NPDC028030]|uniref:hypothetical protein n=1 Tax=Microbacterium sp. NPDC028030 TaxID=3155124 RepID=UPI0033ED83BD
MTVEEMLSYRQMMTDFAEDSYELPATDDQIRYLADMLELSHGALWQTFGTLTRGTASVLISGLIAARSIDAEADHA